MTPSRITTQSIDVHLFEDSLPSFISVLDENAIIYKLKANRPGAIVASGTTIEVIQSAISCGPAWAAFAAVLVALIKNRRSRKLVITTKDHEIIHAEGYSVEEVERILGVARDVTIFEPKKTAKKVENGRRRDAG